MSHPSLAVRSFVAPHRHEFCDSPTWGAELDRDHARIADDLTAASLNLLLGLGQSSTSMATHYATLL